MKLWWRILIPLTFRAFCRQHFDYGQGHSGIE